MTGERGERGERGDGDIHNNQNSLTKVIKGNNDNNDNSTKNSKNAENAEYAINGKEGKEGKKERKEKKHNSIADAFIDELTEDIPPHSPGERTLESSSKYGTCKYSLYSSIPLTLLIFPMPVSTHSLVVCTFYK